MLKLHKLLYFCQGHHVADLGEPLFGESISAWDHGPVVGTLWHQEKHGDTPRPRRRTRRGRTQRHRVRGQPLWRPHRLGPGSAHARTGAMADR
ncbi:Panacea domain-containing protein [Thermomonospora umbrina]|uniref:Panacea domain-containing protein n=1 Tax=Thermomonospora umbrina TaxID=111806 RepID=UPI003CCC8105